MNDIFNNLTTVLDKEISLYKDLENLYTEKKDILIKNDFHKLDNIDAKILENGENLKKIGVTRTGLMSSMGDNINNISTVIENAEKIKSSSTLRLKEQQATLKHLSSSLSVLNLTNMKLIKHGMLLADKQLDIIIESCAPHSTVYSETGKENKDMELSTIIKDV